MYLLVGYIGCLILIERFVFVHLLGDCSRGKKKPSRLFGLKGILKSDAFVDISGVCDGRNSNIILFNESNFAYFAYNFKKYDISETWEYYL